MTHSDVKMFSCHLCDKTFMTPGYLKKHQAVHSGEKKFRCEICLKTFSKAAHLRTHAVVHTKQKDFKCTECGKAFTLQSSMKRHMFLHASSEAKPFECSYCPKKFIQSAHLKKHVQKHLAQSKSRLTRFLKDSLKFRLYFQMLKVQTVISVTRVLRNPNSKDTWKLVTMVPNGRLWTIFENRSSLQL